MGIIKFPGKYKGSGREDEPESKPPREKKMFPTTADDLSEVKVLGNLARGSALHPLRR